jgi:hypothetical protein
MHRNHVSLTSVILGAVLTGCAERVACTRQDLVVRPSPGDDLKAVVFTRSCGPDDATLNVSIVPRTAEATADPGNVLALRVDLVKGVIDFPKVHWDDTSHLRVNYDSTLRVITKVDSQGTVSIAYGNPASAP